MKALINSKVAEKSKRCKDTSEELETTNFSSLKNGKDIMTKDQKKDNKE